MNTNRKTVAGNNPATIIHMHVKDTHRTRRSVAAFTIILTTIGSFLSFFAPAQAQATYNFSNVVGVGKDIEHDALPATAGSVRLSSLGSNPLGGSLHRGWFGIESPTTFTIFDGQVRVSWSEYLVGVISNSEGGAVGSTFDITPTVLQGVEFSYALVNSATDRLEPAFSGLMSEPHFTTSDLAITKTGDFVIAKEGFGNNLVPFYRYEFSATYENLKQFDAKWVGITYDAAINDNAERVYAASFSSAGGRYSEKIGLMQPRVETTLQDGPALGITIETLGSGGSGGTVSAAEPNAVYLTILAVVYAPLWSRRRSKDKRIGALFSH